MKNKERDRFIIEEIRKLSCYLDLITNKLDNLFRQEVKEVASLDALTAQVKANTDTEGSAVVLLNGLAEQIAGLKNDPVAIQALSDQLKTSADNLAAAIVTNTPA